MPNHLIVFALLLGISMPLYASVSIEQYGAQEFNPSLGQTFDIPVRIDEPGSIQVEIFTPDGDLVRSLPGGRQAEAGVYPVTWDGRDQAGTPVPDEAYIPVVRLVTGRDGEAASYDPRAISGGGEVILPVTTNARQQLIFQLDKPSRILARAGVKSGPMMKSILNWQVRGRGRNMALWNGSDQDGLVNLYDNDNLALLVTGFELPLHSIIAVGNENLEYLAWRAARQWPVGIPDLSEAQFERDGRRISRHYYLPRSVEIDPRITLEIIDQLPVGEDGIPIVSGPIALRVDMHKEDRWAMQQSLYEVAFFVDYEFLSEEEQGYMPLTWRWNPVGLKPGIHMVTVNVSGFNGQVGVKSLQIAISK
ncbi:FlgD immunoglobulin-like domain containing protein [Microbulbifer sp. 2201CG32-9]|uniref:FlgD immunoglobulin-like domain containing protein n=1 Tax=Microbulbifer sp. 2201CG32-9 TaxID=3232309 RepID=UPI00345B6F58